MVKSPKLLEKMLGTGEKNAMESGKGHLYLGSEKQGRQVPGKDHLDL